MLGVFVVVCVAEDEVLGDDVVLAVIEADCVTEDEILGDVEVLGVIEIDMVGDEDSERDAELLGVGEREIDVLAESDGVIDGVSDGDAAATWATDTF